MPKMGEGYLPLLYVPNGAGRYVKLPVLTTTQRDALSAVEGMTIFNSTTDQAEEYDGSTWEAIGQVILTTHEADFELHKKIVLKAADETVNNSNTLQNDDELLLAIGANEIWDAVIDLIQNSSASADVKVTVTVPSGCGGGLMVFSRDGVTKCVPFATAVTCVSDAADRPFGIRLLAINGSTAGNIQFQWAQATAEASDTIIRAGSCLIATQLS